MSLKSVIPIASLLAVLMFVANGCGQSAPTPPPIAQTDKHVDQPGGHSHGSHDHSGWWCGEHGLPEAECSICSSKAATAFKTKGDWCDEHRRAKSQCFLCDPKLKEKFAALYRAKEGKDPPAIQEELPATESKNDGT